MYLGQIEFCLYWLIQLEIVADVLFSRLVVVIVRNSEVLIVVCTIFKMIDRIWTHTHVNQQYFLGFVELFEFFLQFVR